MVNMHTVVEALRALEGKRVEVVEMKDPYTHLKPGTQGTVAFVDDVGTLHVNWDNGSKLGLVHGEDDYRIIK